MKFLKDNWFKLMTGTSMLVFSFAFLMYAVSPSYANETSEMNKPQMKDGSDPIAVVYNGYLYSWGSPYRMVEWSEGTDRRTDGGGYVYDNKPSKRKLP